MSVVTSSNSGHSSVIAELARPARYTRELCKRWIWRASLARQHWDQAFERGVRVAIDAPEIDGATLAATGAKAPKIKSPCDQCSPDGREKPLVCSGSWCGAILNLLFADVLTVRTNAWRRNCQFALVWISIDSGVCLRPKARLRCFVVTVVSPPSDHHRRDMASPYIPKRFDHCAFGHCRE